MERVGRFRKCVLSGLINSEGSGRELVGEGEKNSPGSGAIDHLSCGGGDVFFQCSPNT